MFAGFAWYLHCDHASSQVRAGCAESEICKALLTLRSETSRRPPRDRSVTNPDLDCPGLFPIQSGMSDSRITMFAVCTVKRSDEHTARSSEHTHVIRGWNARVRGGGCMGVYSHTSPYLAPSPQIPRCIPSYPVKSQANRTFPLHIHS